MKEAFAFHPSEVARATNLMAHPAAGVMALTAIGFGMTGQALGIWAGTMSVAADASRRFWQPLIDDVAPGMNIYIFAVMYDRAVALSASALLIATTLSIATISFWLWVVHALLPA